MKVTYNWLKDFVDIKISPSALAEKLTMAGLEVTSQEKREGDFVFEIEVTSNRPDCLSVIGIAREVAAILGHRLKDIGNRSDKKYLQPTAYNLQPFSIYIEDKKDCPLYTAKIIKGVKVGPSPAWLKKRLELLGCRSVNNIVDITNYILFEWGEPLHAFDLDKVNSDTIIVRRAKKDEKIITIDGQGKTLSPDILVIADKDRPVALAGIMGGEDTEVTGSTKNLLLEAAIFNPIIIRRNRQKLGMQTDSSYRFERGIDLERAELASWQATQLIQEIAGGRCILAKSSRSLKPKKKSINLDVSFASKILGVNIAAAKIKQILNALGFKVKTKSNNNFTIEVPSHRQDVSLEMDLVEEIARIFGFEFIPKSLPQALPQVSSSRKRDIVSLIKNILVGLGLNEVITYSLTDKDLLKFWQRRYPAPIEILNPLSKEQEALRPTIIPSLSRAVSLNLNQQQGYINIFEIAPVFSIGNGRPKEELLLGIALCGMKSLLLGQGLIKDAVCLLHLKGILEVFFDRLGVKNYYFTAENSNVVTIYVNQENIGDIVRPGREILDYLDIKNKEVFILEISLDKLLLHIDLDKKFVRLPIYPGICRDISLILKEEVLVNDILEAIREKGKPFLQEAKIIDCYKGKQIPSGFKGLTISCLYRLDERTLTEEEIAPTFSNISSVLMERFQAQLR